MNLFPYAPTDYDEPRRGRFHFSSRGGWMNDPNGLVHYRGTYHLYYQHNPHSLAWDTMHWGHATSTDLVHWEQRPIALHPEIHPGVLFSGGGVVDLENTSGLATEEHDPVVVFTGTDEIRVMVSLDDGDTFAPLDDGRVVVVPGGRESRDPKVFWHAPSRQWVMVLWSDDDGYGVNFYGSPDLHAWTLLSRISADWLFECPDVSVMALDGDPEQLRYVLVTASGQYLVGDFDGRTFVTPSTQPQTILREVAKGAGSDYWAAQSFSNAPDGRVVSIGWQGRNQGSAWTGNMTFPVEQTLRTTDGRVHVHSEPVAEIALLHRSTVEDVDVAVTGDGIPLGADPAAPGTDGLDVELAVDRARADGATLVLEAVTATGAEPIATYDAREHTLDGLALPPADAVTIRVLLDRDQLAVFAADGRHYTVANRVLEDPERTAEIRLRSQASEGGEGTAVTLPRVTVRTVGPAWT